MSTMPFRDRLGPAVPWNTPAAPTPVEDFRAVDEVIRDYGRPVVPAPLIVRADAPADAPAPLPIIADLTGDRTCVAILRAWARRPWQPQHQAALADYLEETGSPLADQVRRLPCGGEWEVRRLPCGGEWELPVARTRFRRGLLLPGWRKCLRDLSGDFELTSLVGESPESLPF